MSDRSVATRSAWFAWLIVLAAFVLNLVPSYSQSMLSPVAADIMAQYQLDQAQYVSLFTAPSLAPIFLSFVAGVLLDRLGSKMTVFAAAALTAAGTVLRLFASSYALFYLSMVLIGVISSFVLSGCTKIFSRFFPLDKVGLPVGLLYAASSLAMVVGMSTTAIIGVGAAFTLAAGLAVVGMLFWLIIVPGDAKDVQDAVTPSPSGSVAPPSRQPGESPVAAMADAAVDETPSFGGLLKSVLSSVNLWLIIVAVTCIGTLGFAAASMLPTALVERGMDQVGAGGMAALMMVGMLVGSVLVPAIAGKIKNVKAFVVIACVLTAFGCPLVMLAPLGFAEGCLLFVYGLLQYGITPLLISLPIQLPEIGPARAATAGGLLMSIMSAGIAFLPAAVMIPLSGGDSMMFFIICAALCLIAAVAMLFVKVPRHH